MAAYVNQSGAMLILPDRTKVLPGAETDVSKETADDLSVAAWIKDGALVPRVEAEPEPEPEPEPDAKGGSKKADGK